MSADPGSDSFGSRWRHQFIAELRTELPAPAWALIAESGAADVAHSGRNLLTHLAGTWGILKRWGHADDVALAGLFHSIYGTNAFTRKSLPEDARPRLQAAIGESAERLVWLFCHIDRPTAVLDALQTERGARQMPEAYELRARRDQSILQALTATVAELHALAEIECANLIEQNFWDWAVRDLYCAGIDQPVLTRNAMTCLRQGLSHASKQQRDSTHAAGAS